jgi:hypothetical protein
MSATERGRCSRPSTATLVTARPIPSANQVNVPSSVFGRSEPSSATCTTVRTAQRRRREDPEPQQLHADGVLSAAPVQTPHGDREERQHEVEAHLDAQAPGRADAAEDPGVVVDLHEAVVRVPVRGQRAHEAGQRARSVSASQ